MSTRRLIQSTVVLLILSVSYFIGYLTYQYLNDPLRLYQGVWYGKGQISFGDKKVESYATFIIERKSARLSVENRYGQYNYTYDVNLAYKKLNHERSHLEVTERSVNGLEEFLKDTGIHVPSYGTLFRVDGWRVDNDRIFLNIQLSKNNNASILLTKEDEK
ncbi:hypothetical protein LNL84_15470 [Vibrio sp. ZSDZ34]|uniref:Uncharacterized protein n=1 Tax=Vibrio gelatinilyticus TaxID=2893468 RepID=A0A9X1WDT5_9VIBR|nr:hypothetical protein [Vibrio gelatinilyticus]MCJ2378216.1 hypothetical protein [Vibrio gelatinilyticus]